MEKARNEGSRALGVSYEKDYLQSTILRNWENVPALMR